MRFTETVILSIILKRDMTLVIRKLYLAGIVGKKWNIINEWYGIHQGGIWSPTAYTEQSKIVGQNID